MKSADAVGKTAPTDLLDLRLRQNFNFFLKAIPAKCNKMRYACNRFCGVKLMSYFPTPVFLPT